MIHHLIDERNTPQVTQTLRNFRENYVNISVFWAMITQYLKSIAAGNSQQLPETVIDVRMWAVREQLVQVQVASSLLLSLFTFVFHRSLSCLNVLAFG